MTLPCPISGVTLHFDDARLQSPLGCEPLDEWDFPGGVAPAAIYLQGGRYLVRYPGLADFEIARGGLWVRVVPVPGQAAAGVPYLFANQVLPFASSRRGRLVLHASAVDVHGTGVAFIGDSGRGKSTLAASFANAGFRFVADDRLILDVRAGGQCLAIPVWPELRLAADSWKAVNGGAPFPAQDAADKARFSGLEGGMHCPESLPLGRIFLLGPGAAAEPEIRPLRQSDALAALVGHSLFVDRDVPEIFAAHFEHLAAVVRHSDCFAFDFPRRFECLAGARAAVLAQTA